MAPLEHVPEGDAAASWVEPLCCPCLAHLGGDCARQVGDSARALPRLGLSLKPLLARLGVVELLAYRFKLLVERLDAVLEGVDDGLRGVTLGLEGGDLALQRPSRLLVLAACLREAREIEGGRWGVGGWWGAVPK